MDEPKDKPKQPDTADATTEAQDEIERIRDLILQRRNRFVALALAGVGAAANACSSGATVCLSLAPHTSGAGGLDGTSGAGGVAGPNVCLSPWPSGTGGGGFGGVAGFPPVAGTGGAVAGAPGSAGTAGEPPDPCWNNQPPPCVCLEPPFVPEDDAGVDEP